MAQAMVSANGNTIRGSTVETVARGGAAPVAVMTLAMTMI